MTDKERRRFFRIDDTVALSHESIPEHQVEDKINDFWTNQHEYSLRNEFNYKLEEHQADLMIIEKNHPAIARYLKILQAQVDLLSEKIIPDEPEESAHKEVNISAQGISFVSSEPVASGAVVELNLELQPNKQKIVIFAKVIRCEQLEDKQFNITLDYEHIYESDREILIKHIHGKQLKSLGAARFNDEE